jgi:hypothetical protein
VLILVIEFFITVDLWWNCYQIWIHIINLWSGDLSFGSSFCCSFFFNPWLGTLSVASYIRMDKHWKHGTDNTIPFSNQTRFWFCLVRRQHQLYLIMFMYTAFSESNTILSHLAREIEGSCSAPLWSKGKGQTVIAGVRLDKEILARYGNGVFLFIKWPK